MIQRYSENGGHAIDLGGGRWKDPISVELSKPCQSCGGKLDWTLRRTMGEWWANCCGNTYWVQDIFRVVEVGD